MLHRLDNLPIDPIVLHITPEDIRNSSKKRPDACAVAMACRRQLSAREVRVHLSRVFVRTNDSNWVRYMVPTSMRSEIIAFDRGGEFAPGDFKLAVPGKTETSEGRAKAYRKAKRAGLLDKNRNDGRPTTQAERDKLKRRPYHIVKNVRATA